LDDPAAKLAQDLGSIIAELNRAERGSINYFRSPTVRGNKQLIGVATAAFNAA